MALETLGRIEKEFQAEDVEAYKTNYEAFKGGLSKEEIAKYYDKWAGSGEYDAVCICFEVNGKSAIIKNTAYFKFDILLKVANKIFDCDVAIVKAFSHDKFNYCLIKIYLFQTEY